MWDPDRAKFTADELIEEDDYLDITQLSRGVTRIRNICKVSYHDITQTPNADGEYPIQTATAADASSQTKYGVRFCAIQDTPQIDTLAEAQALADAVVADLSEPEALATITFPYRRTIDIEDLLQLQPNGIHFTSAQLLSIVGYRHQADQNGGFTTTVQVRGKPASRYKKWFKRIRPPGEEKDAEQQGGSSFRVEVPRALSLVAADQKSAQIQWRPLINKQIQKRVIGTEVHISETSPIAFDDTTFVQRVSAPDNKAFIRGLVNNTDYYVGIVNVDEDGNRSDPVELAGDLPASSRSHLASFSASQTAPQNFSGSGAFLKMIANTEAFDTYGDFDSATNYRFVAPFDGIYEINGLVRLRQYGNSNSGVGLMEIRQYANGGALLRTVQTRGEDPYKSGEFETVHETIPFSMAATDYIEIYAAVISNPTTGTVAQFVSGRFSGHCVELL